MSVATQTRVISEGDYKHWAEEFARAAVEARGFRPAYLVAQEIGVSRSCYGNFERGEALCNLPAALRLSEVLGFSLDAVFGLQPQKRYATIYAAYVEARIDNPVELARRAGVHRGTVINAMFGKRPKLIGAVAIALVLGFSLDALDWRLIGKVQQDAWR